MWSLSMVTIICEMTECPSYTQPDLVIDLSGGGAFEWVGSLAFESGVEMAVGKGELVVVVNSFKNLPVHS